MTTLVRILNKIANWKTLVILFILYVSFPAYWLKNAGDRINQLAGKPIGPIDLTFGFDPTRTLQMVAEYGPEARAYYTRTELTTDLIYPIVYSLLLAVILTMLFRNKPYKPFAWVTLLPFASLLFDYLENATIVTMLSTYPSQSMPVAVLCEVFKLAKWLSFGLSMGFVLYGLFLWIGTRMKRI
ncbi:MAG: hypothetical protein EAZ91_09360 [Cytophagales bacterium]|nr:MAG: hypothetical protein EAZ91_09360 [Cytophagales bacterium]